MKMLITQTEFDSYHSRQLIPFECEFCKIVFYRPKHRIQDYLKKNNPLECCSNRCAGKLKTLRKRIDLNCDYCNKKFNKLKSELSNRNFCSCSCAGIFNYLNRAPDSCIKPKSPVRNCPKCNKEFSHWKNKFCSVECAGKKKQDRTPNTKCSECGIPLFRRKSQKRKHSFCCRMHQAQYANRTYNRTGRFGINKSKAETVLADLLRQAHPTLNIIENDRKLLGGLEVDLLLPNFKIAIELNGPCHYIPIFGSEELEKTQNKDLIKIKRLQELQFHFIIVNIMGAKKQLNNILQQAVNQVTQLISNNRTSETDDSTTPSSRPKKNLLLNL